MSKGLTPVIAMILLLMMTVAAAGASFYWLLRIQGELQGGTQQFQEQTFEQMTSVVGWQTANMNGTTGNSEGLTLVLANKGTTKIPVDNTSSSGVQWVLLDNEQEHVCTSDWQISTGKIICESGCETDIEVNQLRTIVLELTGACNVTTAGPNAIPADSLMFATIYFGGKASASGQFRTK